MTHEEQQQAASTDIGLNLSFTQHAQLGADRAARHGQSSRAAPALQMGSGREQLELPVWHTIATDTYSSHVPQRSPLFSAGAEILRQRFAF